MITLIAIFIGCLTIANILAFKLISFGPFVFPAGVLAYAITFLVTDVISEIYGKAKVKQVIKAGFITQLFMIALIKLAIILPAVGFWKHQEQFELVLNNSMRIIIASLIAYLMSQYHDAWAFHFWKQKTNNKFLWLRNIFSTTASQLLDTVVFITVAFYGIFDVEQLMQMMYGQLIIKWIIALLDTPLVYMLVYIFRNKEDIYNEGLLCS